MLDRVRKKETIVFFSTSRLSTKSQRNEPEIPEAWEGKSIINEQVDGPEKEELKQAVKEEDERMVAHGEEVSRLFQQRIKCRK
jgi:hypothetical protein